MTKYLPDAYTLHARVYAAFLSLLPTLVVVCAFWPELLKSGTPSYLYSGAGALGVLYGMTVFVRSRGAKVEKRLVDTWGGWPTTIWLRHRGGYLPAATLARYHEFISKHVTKVSIPTAAEEQVSPEEADAQYASAVQWLNEHFRHSKTSLHQKENAEFGFRCNIRGMRVIGIWLCLVDMFVAGLIWHLLQSESAPYEALSLPSRFSALFLHSWIGGAIAFNLIALGAWIAVPTDDWVREAGDQYARALLANCDAEDIKTTEMPSSKGLGKKKSPKDEKSG